MAEEALKVEALPWKTLTAGVGDVPFVALAEVVSPASAACCEAEVGVAAAA